MSATQPRLVHEALVYSSDEEFLERVVPFLQDGLAASEPTSGCAHAGQERTAARSTRGRRAARLVRRREREYRRPAPAFAEYRRDLEAELSRPDVERVRVIGEIPLG